MLHALLNIKDFHTLSGHPIIGESWEGFVIENLLSVAPVGTQPSFYRTSTGAEIDLVLELPNGDTWAIEIKSRTIAKPKKGFYSAIEDIQATRSFVVYIPQIRIRSVFCFKTGLAEGLEARI